MSWLAHDEKTERPIKICLFHPLGTTNVTTKLSFWDWSGSSWNKAADWTPVPCKHAYVCLKRGLSHILRIVTNLCCISNSWWTDNRNWEFLSSLLFHRPPPGERAMMTETPNSDGPTRLFSADSKNESFNALDQGRAAEMKHWKHTVSS